jgi:farnesyl diphosphate synthase
MDDDDLRRGKPTTHKAYDEATAILAGDALLTLAFDILSREKTHPDAKTRIELVKLYAQNSGLGGMVGGQMLDLAAEQKPSISEEEILTLQAMKTGALIRCACHAGAILGGASKEEQQTLFDFGDIIGQAFQLADDILDVTSDAETMGKQTAKDADKGKGTLVSLYGVEESQKRAKELLEMAIETLVPFGKKADILIEAARFTIERKN